MIVRGKKLVYWHELEGQREEIQEPKGQQEQQEKPVCGYQSFLCSHGNKDSLPPLQHHTHLNSALIFRPQG